MDLGSKNQSTFLPTWTLCSHGKRVHMCILQYVLWAVHSSPPPLKERSILIINTYRLHHLYECHVVEDISALTQQPYRMFHNV